jgi:hypothetical protein
LAKTFLRQFEVKMFWATLVKKQSLGNFDEIKCIGATLAKTFFAKLSEINVFGQLWRGESFGQFW